jgi:flagellar FliL protein
MAVQRPEPARGADEKRPRDPQPADTEAPPAKSPGSSPWKAWLPLALAILLMPLVAYAVTSFVLVPRMQKALRVSAATPGETGQSSQAEAPSSEKGEKSGPPHTGQKQNVTLSKLLVNVAGTMGSRYLLTSITLLGQGSDFPNRVTQNEPQLRDMASGLLSTKTIVDLEKPGARNLIRGELLAGFNSILGNGSVQEIYFTEFAVQ